MIQHDDDDERICPGCDAPESQWVGFENKGVAGKSGEFYCCQACSSGQACSCNPDRLESLVKRGIAS